MYMRAQRMFRPVWASVESDQSIRRQFDESLRSTLSTKRTARAKADLTAAQGDQPSLDGPAILQETPRLKSINPFKVCKYDMLSNMKSISMNCQVIYKFSKSTLPAGYYN